MNVCDMNCFECKFDDCILSDDDIVSSGSESGFVDSLLFSDSDNPNLVYVPSHLEYDFIPSDEIPFNPNWKSQARWREYYRSKARGNRRDKINASARFRYRNDAEYRAKINASARFRYQNDDKRREYQLSYQSQYYQDHKDEIRERKKRWYQENKERIKEQQRSYRTKKREG